MLKEITMFEFNEFAQKQSLASMFQTSSYALLMAENNYDYEYIGFYENNNLIAASLILLKKITFKIRYGYAPRGFLIDYNNQSLVEKFTTELINYYQRKKVAFIKIDPYLIINEYNPKNKNIIKTNNYDYLKDLKYKKLKDNLYFESQKPRFECIIDLKNYDFSKLTKNTRNKVNKSISRGITLEKASFQDFNLVYEFIKKKNIHNYSYYDNLYKAFSENNVDLFLLKVNYEEYMEIAKDLYDQELDHNKICNEKLKNYSNKTNLNKKLVSDKKLITYKNAVMEASRKFSDNEIIEYIAGAITVKYQNKVYLIDSGYNAAYRHLNPNYCLFYSLIEYYKSDFSTLNLNGISGDFSKENKFYGLNEFKLGFNPQLYEYIGELDLIINDKVYNNLLMTGKLHKELDKN